MVCNCPHHPHSTRIAIAREHDTHEKQLIAFIEHDDINGVRRKLAAGARVNGCRKEDYHPIVTTVRERKVAVMKPLLKEGADPDSAEPLDVFNSDGELLSDVGPRPLQYATERSDLDVFRVLVRAGAPLNTPDALGRTPLMMALTSSADGDQEDRQTRIVLVRELLEAGVDLTLRDMQGWSALHFAAGFDDPEPVKMLVWKMPGAMKFLTNFRQTPLYVAARYGRQETVSQLLAMGASQPAPHGGGCSCGCKRSECPLWGAVREDHVNVVNILLESVDLIGGLEATIPSAIQVACNAASIACSTLGEHPEKWAKVLQVLPTVEGEERQGHWVRSRFLHSPVLAHAAVTGNLTTISLLLAAGADETVRNSYGQTASEAVADRPHGGRAKGPAEKAATRRMLARGPAFRARSWAWPVPSLVEDEDVDGVATSDASPSSVAVKHSALGVRIWRSKSRKRSVRLIGRHALKGVAAAKNENPVHDLLARLTGKDSIEAFLRRPSSLKTPRAMSGRNCIPAPSRVCVYADSHRFAPDSERA